MLADAMMGDELKQAFERASAERFEPEIVAHPDIVDHPPAIAEMADLADQPRGRLIEAIVVSGRDLLAMLGQHGVADLQHRARAVAGNITHLDPAIGS